MDLHEHNVQSPAKLNRVNWPNDSHSLQVVIRPVQGCAYAHPHTRFSSVAVSGCDKINQRTSLRFKDDETCSSLLAMHCCSVKGKATALTNERTNKSWSNVSVGYGDVEINTGRWRQTYEQVEWCRPAKVSATEIIVKQKTAQLNSGNTAVVATNNSNDTPFVCLDSVHRLTEINQTNLR